jgi:hypothetical protein
VSPATPDAKVRQQSQELLEADHAEHVFVFLRTVIIGQLYKLILSDQAHATLQLSVSLSDLA